MQVYQTTRYPLPPLLTILNGVWHQYHRTLLLCPSRQGNKQLNQPRDKESVLCPLVRPSCRRLLPLLSTAAITTTATTYCDHAKPFGHHHLHVINLGCCYYLLLAGVPRHLTLRRILAVLVVDLRIHYHSATTTTTTTTTMATHKRRAATHCRK